MPTTDLGPRPSGDPAAMCSYAAALDRAATAQTTAAGRAAAAIAGCGFIAPAATRMRAAAGEAKDSSASCGDSLVAVASDIRRRAGQIEDAQGRWDRAKARATEA